MRLNIEITEEEIKELIANHINCQLGDSKISTANVYLLVKSKQNYRSEWESAGAIATSNPEDYIPSLKVVAKT